MVSFLTYHLMQLISFQQTLGGRRLELGINHVPPVYWDLWLSDCFSYLCGLLSAIGVSAKFCLLIILN